MQRVLGVGGSLHEAGDVYMTIISHISRSQQDFSRNLAQRTQKRDKTDKLINWLYKCARVDQAKKDETALGTHGPNKLQIISWVFLALKIGQPPASRQNANTAIPLS